MEAIQVIKSLLHDTVESQELGPSLVTEEQISAEEADEYMTMADVNQSKGKD